MHKSVCDKGWKAGVDFVDLGFGDGLRLKELAGKPRHGDKSFVGVERPGAKRGAVPEPGNVEYRFRGAREELERMPASSVNVVNADFGLADYHEVGGGGDTDQRTLELRGGGEEARLRLAKDRLMTLRSIMRVLNPKGRLYLTEYSANMPSTTGLLELAGFSWEARRLTEDELEKTTQLKELKAHLLDHREDEGYRWPMRIAARKGARAAGGR